MNGYGIDSMVQSRADAYRANPDGLAKSYANNQQLIDLLALQKLKSEKEAAARQLTLSAQQAPGTVAQQREQELLGLTRNEIAQQTGAIGEQQEQQMLQQAGLAGLPAQNLESMQGYAEGGVVGYAEGGSPNLFPSPADTMGAMGSIPNLVPSPADTARVIAWLAEKGIDATKFTAEQIAEVLQNIDTFPGKEGMSAYGTTERPSIGELAKEGLASLNELGRFDGTNSSTSTDAIVRGGERALGGLSGLYEGAKDIASMAKPALDVAMVPGQELGKWLADLKIQSDRENAEQQEEGRSKLAERDPELAAMLAEQQARIDGEPMGRAAAPAPAVSAPATVATPRTNTQDMQDVGGLSSLIPRAAAPAAAPTAPVAAPTAPRERTALEQALEEAQLAALQTSGEDARNAGQQTAEDFFSPQTEARNARYAEIQRKLQEIDAREADPKARAKEAMREWMRGAANTSGGLSRLLQGGGNQSRAYIDEQEAADKARMMEMFGLEKELGAEELAMARDIFGAGENAEDRNSSTLNTALQTVTQTLEGALNREAEAKFNADRNELLLRQVDVDEARNALEQGRLSNAEFQTKVTALGRQYDMMLSGLEAQLKNTLPGTPDEMRINTAIEELSGQYARTMQELTSGVMPSMGSSAVPQEQVMDYTEFFAQ